MTIRNRPSIRGLRDIRSHAARVEKAGVPYMTYMKISALEMEKARRETEKLSAETRIKNIDRRLAEIEAEKEALLKGVGERTNTAGPSRAGDKSAHARQDGEQGFRVKY